MTYEGSDTSLPYVRPHGRPKVEKNPVSGFRKITRTYVVDPEAARSENVEGDVFLPYGTSDLEYEDALLAAQQLNPSEDVDKTSLTRVYLELPAPFCS